MNRTILIGRLTRDPEIRTTSSGKQVASFSIAVRKNKDEADFFRVEAWGKLAEYVDAYLSKGRLVAIDGRLTCEKYTAKDGSQREQVKVVADNVQGLDRPTDSAPTTGAGDDFDPFGDE